MTVLNNDILDTGSDVGLQTDNWMSPMTSGIVFFVISFLRGDSEGWKHIGDSIVATLFLGPD